MEDGALRGSRQDRPPLAMNVISLVYEPLPRQSWMNLSRSVFHPAARQALFNFLSHLGSKVRFSQQGKLVGPGGWLGERAVQKRR